jgi:exoribonuclease R
MMPFVSLQGHYVRTLGPIGDVNTETEVVLLEHAVPFEAFSKGVMRYCCTFPIHTSFVIKFAAT